MKESAGSESSKILIEPDNGYAVCQNVFSCRIFGAVSKTHKNGDSLLINLKRRIFAVADSTEWNANISKDLLERFNIQIEEIYQLFGNIEGDDDRLNAFCNLLIENTNKLIFEIRYPNSTTFSCLIILPGTNGKKGLILHCGDSLIFEIRQKKGHISQLTNTTLNLAGRVDKLTHVLMIDIKDDSKFVICSDGLTILTRMTGSYSLPQILMEVFSQAGIDMIPNLLIDRLGKDLDFIDDTTIITIHPYLLPLSDSDEVILWGGAGLKQISKTISSF